MITMMRIVPLRQRQLLLTAMKRMTSRHYDLPIYFFSA
jgi:hypothetical protein